MLYRIKNSLVMTENHSRSWTRLFPRSVKKNPGYILFCKK